MPTKNFDDGEKINEESSCSYYSSQKQYSNQP